MSYSDPIMSQTLSFGLIDFGAGNTALSFKGPLGMKGILREVTVVATEVFNSVTTGANVTIGTSGDADAYALVNLTDLGATDTFVASQDDTDGIINNVIPANTQVEMVMTAPTGGTPSGIGYVFIDIDWGA